MTVAILLRRAQARPGAHDEDQILGPCERGALTLGLRLAGQRGREAVAIAVGPARREDRVLAMALRAGCARGLRVWDEGLDELDYLGLAEVLAAAVRAAGAGWIVCGERSVDERTGGLGPALAELLGAPHVSNVIDAEVDADELTLTHRAAVGTVIVQVTGTVVITAAAPPVRARDDSPSPPAGNQAIAAKDLAELGLDPRRLAPRRALAGRLRPLRGPRQATILPDAAALVERLRGDRILDGGGEP